MILNLTTKWYETVLSKVKEGSTILDVGVGTASALINCKHILKQRNLKIVGIDYDLDYIIHAQRSIELHDLSDYVTVAHRSVYDLWNRNPLSSTKSSSSKDAKFLINDALKLKRNSFDAIYFSGSFSLLPDPIGALQAVMPFLKKEKTEEQTENDSAGNSSSCCGNIYITQTYQRCTPPFLPFIKPVMKYFTSIDFGALITEKQAKQMFYEDIPNTVRVSGQRSPSPVSSMSSSSSSSLSLQCVEHDIIPNSVNTMFQAAYLTVLQPQELYRETICRSEEEAEVAVMW